MTTYVFVLISVFLTFGLAQTLDQIDRDPINGIVHHTRLSKASYLVGACILIVVAGLRYRVGTDYVAYYSYFDRYAKDLSRAFSQLDEPGIRLIAYCIRRLSDDGAVFIFACSFVTLALMTRTVYRYTSQLLFSGLLFLFCGGWSGSFNGVRQYLATAVAFSAYPYLRNRKLVKYMLCVFIAFLFHKSAIIMVVPYFVVQMKISWRNTLLIVIGCVLVLYLYEQLYEAVDFLMDSNVDWDSDYMSSRVNIFRTLVAIAPAAFYLVAYAEKEKSEDQTLWLNLLIIHAVAMTISSQSAYIARIGIYTSSFSVIAIPELNKDLNPRLRGAFMFLILVLFFVFWWYELSNSTRLNNFTWIWQR